MEQSAVDWLIGDKSKQAEVIEVLRCLFERARDDNIEAGG